MKIPISISGWPFPFLLVILFVQCNVNKQQAGTRNDVEVKRIVIDPSFVEPKRNDPFSIRDYYIQADELVVDVAYSGGCEEHSFELLTNQRYEKGYPPQLDIFLKHDAKDDRCKSLVYKTLRFDLSDIQFPGSSILTLLLNREDLMAVPNDAITNRKTAIKYTY